MANTNIKPIDVSQIPILKESEFAATTPTLRPDAPSSHYKSATQNTPTLQFDKQFFSDNPTQFMSARNIEEGRETVAENQSYAQLAGSVLNQAVIGEIVGGTIESVSGMTKFIDRVKGTAGAFERNYGEEVGNSIREWARDTTPIWQTKDARENLAVGDATFWANLTPSVVSTISMMLPAMGVSTAARYLGLASEALSVTALAGRTGKVAAGVTKALGLTEAVNVVKLGDETMNAWKAVNEVYKTSKALGTTSRVGLTADVLIPALASRQMDSAREGVGRYEQYYNEYKQQFAGQPDGEQKAREYAAKAAHSGYIQSFGNVIFDIAEWSILDKLMRPVSKTLTQQIGGAVAANPKAAEVLGEATTQAFKGESFLTRLGKVHVPNTIKVGLMEGFDETSMDFFMNEGKRSTDIEAGKVADDGSNKFERFLKHHTVAKNWESFIGGALGGILMGGAGQMKGYIQNRYFDKEGQTRINNIANSFLESVKNFQETTTQYQSALNKGDKISATMLRTKLITDMLDKSAANGTLDLHIQMLENIDKLSPEEKASLDFISEADKSDKNAEFDSKQLLQDLKTYRDVYNKEVSKIRTTKPIDKLIGLNVARSKVTAMMLGSEISKLEKEIKEQDGTDLDALTREELQNAHAEAVTYYDKMKQVRNMQAYATMVDDTHAQAIEERKFQINELDKQNGQLELELEAETDPLKKKVIESKLLINKVTMNMHNQDIQAYSDKSAKLKEAVAKAETEFDEFKKTLTGLSEYETAADRIYNENKSAVQRNSFLESLKQQREVVNTKLAKLQTAEGYAEFQRNYDELVNANKESAIALFKVSLESANTEEDVDKLVNGLTNLDVDSTTLAELNSLANSRKETIKANPVQAEQTINAAGSNAQPVTTPVTQQDRINEINRKRREELNSIREIGNKQGVVGKLINRVNQTIQGGKFAYTSLDAQGNTTSKIVDSREVAEQQIRDKYDDLVNKELDSNTSSESQNPTHQTSHSFSPTGITSVSQQTPSEQPKDANGNIIVVGQNVFIIANNGTVGSEMFTVNRIDSNTGKITIASTTRVTKKGKPSQKTISSQNLTSVAPTLLSSVANPVTPTFESDLTKAIESHNARITKDEATHEYTLDKGLPTSKKAKTSASQISGTKYPGSKPSNTDALDFGNITDTLVRDFFNNQVKTASDYKMTEEQFNGVKEYLANLQKYFNNRGLKVLANNIKFFDEESGVAGEVDLLLVDSNNNVYIYDVKTSGLKNGINRMFDTYNGYSTIHSYITQLNVYAALFKKVFGVNVQGLGLIPFSTEIVYNTTTNEKRFGTIDKMEIDESDVVKAIQQNRDKSNPNSKSARVVYEHGILKIDVNQDVLNEPSVDKGVSIAEYLKLPKPVEFIDSTTADSEILGNHFAKLMDVMTKVYAEDNLNMELKGLIESFGMFELTIENGKPKVAMSVIAPFIFESADFRKYRGFADYIKTVYSSNYELFRDSFAKAHQNKVIDNGDFDTLFVNTVAMLSVVADEYQSALDIQNLHNSPVDILHATPNVVVGQSNEVIKSLNRILQQTLDGGVDSYFDAMRNNILFIQDVLQLKKLITLDTSASISIPEVIKLVKQAYINTDSEQDVDAIMPVLANVARILYSVKEDAEVKMKGLIEAEKVEQKDKGNDVSFDYSKKEFVDANGNTVDWHNTYRYNMYLTYLTLSDTIHAPVKIEHRNGEEITTRKHYTESQILDIYHEYVPVSNVRDSAFLVELNPELNNQSATRTVDEDNIYSIIDALVNNASLEMTKDGNGHIQYYYTTENGTRVNIGRTENISTHVKGFKIVDANGKYVGFKSILEKDVLNDLLFGVNGAAEYLKTVYQNRLDSNAKNKKDNVVKTAKTAYKQSLADIRKDNSENTVQARVKAIIDSFAIANMSKDEAEAYNALSSAEKYDDDTINNVLDVLFFGVQNSYIDTYKPTMLDISERLKTFDNISNKNVNRYNTLANAFKTKDTITGVIEDVSKPSILISDTRENGKVVRHTLLESVVPTIIDSKDKTSRINIINKRNINNKTIIVDSRTGAPIYNVELSQSMLSKAAGFYVVLKSTNGKFTAFPLRANTLAQSYSNSKIDEDANTDLSQKAVEHVGKAIKDILHATIDISDVNPVGEKDADTRSDIFGLDDDTTVRVKNKYIDKINSIVRDAKLQNIIICKGDTNEDKSYTYFDATVFPANDAKTLDIVVKFTTIKNGNKQYHKITVNNGIMKYYSVDRESSKDDFYEKLSILNSSRPMEASMTVDLSSSSADEQIDKLLMGGTNPLVGNLLRQTFYNKQDGRMSFGVDNETNEEISTFTDPITGITYEGDGKYTASQKHALETNSLYNYIGFVTNENDESKPISNLDLFGAAPVRFNVGVQDVTKVKKGKMSKKDIGNIREFATETSQPFHQVFEAMDLINTELNNVYPKRIVEEYWGEAFDGTNQSKIAGISARKDGDKVTFRYSFTDNFISNMTNGIYENNPIVGLLHEHVHKVIKSMVLLTNIEDVNTKRKLIADNNKLVSDFITSFKTDFDLFIGSIDSLNAANIAKLEKELGMPITNIRSIVSAFINLVEKDVNDANDRFNKGNDVTGDMVAQELYTYITNPYIMKVLSIVVPTGDNATPAFSYTRKSNRNFIDVLVDKLIEIYSKIVGTFSGRGAFSEMTKDTILKDGTYFRHASDMLADLYDSFTNPSVENIQPIETPSATTEPSNETSEPTSNGGLTLEDILGMYGEESDVSNLEYNGNSSIFVQSAKEVLNTSIKDDSNLPLC